MQTSNSVSDEESALLQSTVQTEGHKPSTSKVVTAAIASALLLGLAYASIQVFPTGISNPTDLASAFGNDYPRETSKNSDGSLIYLDRHNMNGCGSDPMSRFKVTDAIKFSYRCQSMVDTAVVDTYTDRTKPEIYGGIQFLDRHSAYCKKDYLMSQLKGGNDWGFYWSFTCRKYDFENSQCRTKNTAWNELGGSNTMIYLDRHDVSCDSGSALQGYLPSILTSFSFNYNP